MTQAIKNWRIWLTLSLLLIAGAGSYFFSQEESQPYQGTELSGIAPDFRLIDQNGDLISLSDFRGRIIVLTFMDGQCKDICPLTSVQLIQTFKSLDQSEADRVIFLGVNVNIDANKVTDMSLATKKWRLRQIPNWHFLTGSAKDLALIWSEYEIAVNPHPSSGIMHTPGVFLIDPTGQKRWYISTPFSVEGNSQTTLPLNELLVNHLRNILKEN